MSDDEANIPDRDTCQKLTEEFAEITQTNEALAQTFLQDHKWKLDRSVLAFYDALNKEQSTEKKRKYSKIEVVDLSLENGHSSALDTSAVTKLFGEGKAVTTEPPPRMKMITWNLDGLDEKNLKKRTRHVIKIIRNHEPDIVFFQEVISETAEYFLKKLPEYKCVAGNHEGYFTMTLLRVFTIFYDDHEVHNFESSRMGRNLLVTEAHMGKLKLKLVNAHLESTAEHADERVRQLKKAFEICKGFSKENTVVFGGDLNLRDKEAVDVAGFFDLWEFCGSEKEFKFTWDMSKNSNHSGFGKFKPKSRFDRVYFRFGEPKIAKPVRFALLGFEKVPETQSFPSDHWGIVVLFDLNHSLAK